MHKKFETMQKYVPMWWDSKKFAFVPQLNCTESGMFFEFPEEECKRICDELNELVKLCSYKPKAGDIYYHPVTFVEPLGIFTVMDNQATSDKSPYPACASQEDCQKICDLMNHVLEESLLEAYP